MNFGNFEPLQKPASYVSADAIIFRRDDNKLLVSERRGEPWNGCITLAFGGYVDPSDSNPLFTVQREVFEETGVNLSRIYLVGIYGPARYHHTLHRLGDGSLSARKELNIKAHKRPVVAFVFAGQADNEPLKDTEEQKGLCWVDPLDLVGQRLAFDHAHALADFLSSKKFGSTLAGVRPDLFIK